MVFDNEAFARRHPGKRLGNGGLDVVGHDHVPHRPALRADEMVVVTGEVLNQLEAGPVAGGHDLADHPGAFEHRQVPIHRALRKSGIGLQDLGDRQRVVGGSEDLDELASTGRVALSVVGQATRSDGVHVVRHRQRRYPSLRTGFRPSHHRRTP